jgi:hypothetical protein
MPSSTAGYIPPGSPEELVLAWLRRARESQMAHYEEATALTKRGYWLGVPVIALTAIVGTSVFASIATEVIPVAAKLIVGALSVAATVLSSLQTFFKFSERAEEHKVYGARFGSVRRELEVFYASGMGSQQPNYIAVLREKLDRLAEEAPNVSSDALQRVQRTLRAQEKPDR